LHIFRQPAAEIFDPVQLHAEIESAGQRRRSGQRKCIALPRILQPFRFRRFVLVVRRRHERRAALQQHRGGPMRHRNNARYRCEAGKFSQYAQQPMFDAFEIERAIRAGRPARVGPAAAGKRLAAAAPKAGLGVGLADVHHDGAAIALVHAVSTSRF
jgi:hypothetical protein